MGNLRQAAQQALEVLENLQGGCTDSGDGTVEAITVWCPEVIEALKQALAEPEHYAAQNPLGGPAKVFDAMADAIRSGDDYHATLRRYGFAEVKAPQPEQEPVAWLWWGDNGDGTESKYVHIGQEFSTYWKPVRPPTPLYTSAPTPRKPLSEAMKEQCPYPEANPTLRGAFYDGWLRAEAAHGITGGTK